MPKRSEAVIVGPGNIGAELFTEPQRSRGADLPDVQVILGSPSDSLEHAWRRVFTSISCGIARHRRRGTD